MRSVRRRGAANTSAGGGSRRSEMAPTGGPCIYAETREAVAPRRPRRPEAPRRRRGKFRRNDASRPGFRRFDPLKTFRHAGLDLGILSQIWPDLGYLGPMPKTSRRERGEAATLAATVKKGVDLKLRFF